MTHPTKHDPPPQDKVGSKRERTEEPRPEQSKTKDPKVSPMDDLTHEVNQLFSFGYLLENQQAMEHFLKCPDIVELGDLPYELSFSNLPDA